MGLANVINMKSWKLIDDIFLNLLIIFCFFIVILNIITCRNTLLILFLLVFIASLSLFKYRSAVCNSYMLLYIQNKSIHSKQKIDLSPLCGDDVNINVITRTGKRERCYTQLFNSLKKQTHNNFRHVLTIDNPNCSFIDDKESNDIVNVVGEVKTGLSNCYYNKYLNKAIKRCDEDSWLIFLDDDILVYDTEFLSRLAKIASVTPKDTFFTMGNKLYDTATICIHRDLAIKHKWGGSCGGDIRYIYGLLKSGSKRVIYNELDPGCKINNFGISFGLHNECN